MTSEALLAKGVRMKPTKNAGMCVSLHHARQQQQQLSSAQLSSAQLVYRSTV